MTRGEREKWNQRYIDEEYRPRSYASPYVERWIESMPRGRALDVACGAGRNALLLAQAGFEVDAIDISEVAIERARAEAAARELEVNWMVADLDETDPEPGAYDVILVIRYVNRPLWPKLARALRPDGWLVIEHHLQTSVAVDGPSSDEFRLAPQELLREYAASLRVLSFEELIEAERDGGTYALQRLAACNGDPGW